MAVPDRIRKSRFLAGGADKLSRWRPVRLAVVGIVALVILFSIRAAATGDPSTAYVHAAYWMHDHVYLVGIGYIHTLFFPYSITWTLTATAFLAALLLGFCAYRRWWQPGHIQSTRRLLSNRAVQKLLVAWYRSPRRDATRKQWFKVLRLELALDKDALADAASRGGVDRQRAAHLLDLARLWRDLLDDDSIDRAVNYEEIRLLLSWQAAADPGPQAWAVEDSTKVDSKPALWDARQLGRDLVFLTDGVFAAHGASRTQADSTDEAEAAQQQYDDIVSRLDRRYEGLADLVSRMESELRGRQSNEREIPSPAALRLNLLCSLQYARLAGVPFFAAAMLQATRMVALGSALTEQSHDEKTNVTLTRHNACVLALQREHESPEAPTLRSLDTSLVQDGEPRYDTVVAGSIRLAAEGD